MLKLPTVILHHKTLAGTHYDWLWLDPVTRDQLQGFRIPYPPSQWQSKGSFLATPLPPHRLIYLNYQGKIANHRGSVTQVAKGTVQGHRIGQVGYDWQLLPSPGTPGIFNPLTGQLKGSDPVSRCPRVRIMPIHAMLYRVTII